MIKEKELVSVVMLSFNRKNDVKEGVQQLLTQNYKNIEIIVVDNGSSDGTPEMLKQEYPFVKLLPLPKNIGVAAYNKGFSQAKGKYIVILDDDSFPESNAITIMVKKFSYNENLGVVAFDVRNYYDYRKTNIDINLNCIKTSQTNEITQKKSVARYQMAFNGAGVGIRKKCIEEVGGYPEEFFLYWNEQDLAIRILNAGYRIQWFSEIIAFHKYSPTNRESQRAPFYYTRNLFWLIWKYFPLSILLKDTLQLLFYSLYYTFEQKSMVYLKALFNALFRIGYINRQPVKKSVIANIRLTYRLAFIYFK